MGAKESTAQQEQSAKPSAGKPKQGSDGLLSSCIATERENALGVLYPPKGFDLAARGDRVFVSCVCDNTQAALREMGVRTVDWPVSRTQTRASRFFPV